MRGAKRTHEDGDGIDAGGRRVGGVMAGDGELVVFAGAGGAAAGDDERIEKQQCVVEAIEVSLQGLKPPASMLLASELMLRPPKARDSHWRSPGLCSRGFEERIRV